ncbi:hypothetical protein CRYUN_Cryun01aG0231300 [Craigia yunnanensis]
MIMYMPCSLPLIKSALFVSGYIFFLLFTKIPYKRTSARFWTLHILLSLSCFVLHVMHEMALKSVSLDFYQHMNEQNILNAVTIEKDVDGFHPLNPGHLAMRGREPLFVPCAPKGCIELLHRYGVNIKGKRAVVIGRSNIVGMPVALLLQRDDATISIVHSGTKNPEEIRRQADIIISAVGQPNMVRGSWIKPGAVIIDVGINPVEDASSSQGYRLVGDVCYEEACKIATAVTPVPGGVGPMTIAMLLSNSQFSKEGIQLQVRILKMSKGIFLLRRIHFTRVALVVTDSSMLPVRASFLRCSVPALYVLS